MDLSAFGLETKAALLRFKKTGLEGMMVINRGNTATYATRHHQINMIYHMYKYPYDLYRKSCLKPWEISLGGHREPF
jgi:hypothetical protein